AVHRPAVDGSSRGDERPARDTRTAGGHAGASNAAGVSVQASSGRRTPTCPTVGTVMTAASRASRFSRLSCSSSAAIMSASFSK
ncbi:hypothetical protein NYY70_21500, partial [Acinetobacter baumannii]|nr:hypothetical protein [Acinetobacter baumannii]